MLPGYSAGGKPLNKTSLHVRFSGTPPDPPTGSSTRRFPDKDLKQHQTLKPLDSLLNLVVKRIKGSNQRLPEWKSFFEKIWVKGSHRQKPLCFPPNTPKTVEGIHKIGFG